jgi:hypothetical protein
VFSAWATPLTFVTVDGVWGSVGYIKQHSDRDRVDTPELCSNMSRLRQIGSVKEYRLRFNSLILQIDSMSEEEQKFMHVRGLKANVKMDIEKEWVRDPDLDLTRMKQLADRTDTLFFNNRGGRTVESRLGAPNTSGRVLEVGGPISVVESRGIVTEIGQRNWRNGLAHKVLFFIRLFQSSVPISITPLLGACIFG